MTSLFRKHAISTRPHNDYGFIMATFPTFSIRTPAQSSLEDEVIRSVFGVSLEPLAGANTVFLPNLSSQISALSNLASSFFTQPAPVGEIRSHHSISSRSSFLRSSAQTQNQNPMAIDLASILSNLSGANLTQNNPSSNSQNVNTTATTPSGDPSLVTVHSELIDSLSPQSS